jgi:hypothetical protein
MSARPDQALRRLRRGWVGQLNSRRVRRPAGLVGRRCGTDAVSLVVCDDAMHREQTGFGRPGAKGLLHIG